jgi:hypothetical protein
VKQSYFRVQKQTMSKLALTASGAGAIATAVPLMHLLLKRYPAKHMGVKVTTMLFFVMGWVLFTIGLSKPPPGTETTVGDAWKKRQLGLAIAGAVLVVGGVGAVRGRDKLKFPLGVGASAFVAGWAVLTAGVVHSDPEFGEMGKSEKIGRVIQSITSSLIVMIGAALISMSDNPLLPSSDAAVSLNTHTLEAAAVLTFVAGWVNTVSVSALQ